MKTTTPMLLQARQLQLKYRRRVIWDIPQLYWHQGESIYLRGINGSGKTSLMKVIAGLQSPSKGQVKLNPSGHKPANNCCYLHQHPWLFSNSVRNNLLITGHSHHLKGLNHQQLNRQLDDLLVWAGLMELAEQPARTLSGGERQRLALARARLIQPRFWLLDEPTASLDEQSVQRLALMLEELQQQGVGLLLTSHQQNAVTELCSQQWMLDNGQLHI
ncbi:ABC transporter ATP-binding protein [Marinospirillum alkaliphilum]|uniref:Tungstate transport system ATP-binding protein n=1 Tax=Marinospirillum alkaliphilum DSM 21637 TaxID=1122209 RepID=A0A1K1ZPL8_9GAMM|nr:ATP-binding cassette domain-containing protein [Marinospirillum alkaliphilum]SFX75628.1 tungstate transport system ATP-binding protein [Marinospirillum alkaliphilum DSM 21637]